MITGYITHEEAMIRSFMEEPEFADYLMSEILADGDANEIKRFQDWYNEAQRRRQEVSYWSSVVDHAERTAANGKNLDLIIGLVNTALEILKSATTKEPVTA